MQFTGSVSRAISSGAGTAQDKGANKGLDPRLKPAAHEFEASLMEEIVKPMLKDPLFSSGTDGQSGDGSDQTLMSFGAQALAEAISNRGGFGIANKIIAHFEKQAQPAKSDGGNSEGILRMGSNR
jgi:Rod binding domain-containing protein